MAVDPVHGVPNELWMDIFETINVPQDLYNVALTCKKFYRCGIRALLRNLIWNIPQHLSANLPTWVDREDDTGRDHPLCADVKSLQVGVSTASEFHAVVFVDEHGHLHHGPLAEEPEGHSDNWPLTKSMKYYRVWTGYNYATPQLYDQMLQRMTTFTNLERLQFRDLVFTDDLFAVVHNLPALRRLHIELCLFPGRHHCRIRDHSTLPLTELTLLNLRRRVSHIHEFDGNNGGLMGIGFVAGANGQGFAIADLDDDLTHVLRLALAHDLRMLHIDSTADVLGRVFCVWDGAIPGYVYNIPQNLERLYISKKMYHRGQVQPQFAGEQFFPDRALYALFSRCPTIYTLSLELQLPRHTSFPDECLPNLRHCEGLAEALVATGAGRPLEAVSLLWSDNVLYGTLDSLALIAENHGPRLKMLAVECPAWDEEVLHAVCTLFPELRRLKLTHWAKGPSEDTIVSLGPLFLSRLPHLHTIQVYEQPQGQSAPTHPTCLFDPTYNSIEDELRDLVIPWNRFCQKLKEVQLCGGWKMIRLSEGGPWEVRRVRRIEIEDFRY